MSKSSISPTSTPSLNQLLPRVRHAYTGKAFPEEHGVSFTLPSRTKQSFKDECDINKIMAQYQSSGVIEFVTRHSPQYADVTGHDFQTAMNTIATANSMFADMPAFLRERFDNDPAQFLDFIQDEGNRPEAEKLGLVLPRPTTPPSTSTQTGVLAAQTTSPTPTPTNAAKSS